MAQQALTTQVACSGRFTLGIGPSHHWIISDQLGLPYDQPALLVRDYLDVLDAAFAGPGPIAVDNDTFRVHSPVDVTDDFGMRVLVAALGPAMLRIAGERTGGTILWMADERAIGDYVVPRITDAATAAGRTGIRVVAGVPVALCSNSEIDGAREYASEVLGHADFSPNYVRLLEHGDAEDVGDTMAAGDESAVLRPAAQLPRRRRHRSRRSGGSARTGCARAQRVSTPHSGVRRVAGARIRFWRIGTHELDGYASP